MIKLGSISYPYLAVAQHYNIEYGKVLHYAYLMDKYCELDLYDDVDNSAFAEWEWATVLAWKTEHKRRKGLGV